MSSFKFYKSLVPLLAHFHDSPALGAKVSSFSMFNGHS